ncbi:MAG: tetratricopeptide repeat protein [Bacteroidota bacterium]
MCPPVPESLGASIRRHYRAGDPTHPWNAEYDRVLELSDRARSEGATVLDAHSPAWHVRFLRRDFEGALRDLEQAIAIQPEAATHYYHLGLVRERLGDAEGARAAFLEARTWGEANGDDDLLDAVEHHLGPV